MNKSATSRSESSDSDDSDLTAREEDEAKTSKVLSRPSTHNQLNDSKRASSNGTLNMKNMIQELIDQDVHQEAVHSKSIEGSKTSLRSREETKPKQSESRNSSRLSIKSNTEVSAQTTIPVVNTLRISVLIA